MEGLYINEMISPKIILRGHRSLVDIQQKPEGTVSEQELKNVLQSYAIRDGLIAIGKISSFVFGTHDDGTLGKAAFCDRETGVFITQFGLAYLACMLILSGSNDYKKKKLDENDNLLILCNMHGNSLVIPETKKEYTAEHANIISMFIRLYTEQFEYQFDPVLLIARTVVIFTEVMSQNDTPRLGKLSQVFKNETGLDFDEYFALIIAIWAASQRSATFRIEMLTQADVPAMKKYFTTDKIEQVLKMLSADYKTFRNEDRKSNSNLEPVYTKYRFNPFLLYPIIKTQVADPDPYVIPNQVAFIKKAFGGLYWWFHRYYEERNQWHDFRNYYGEVFEQYVGKILKEMYGDNNVHPEIKYDSKKFIDWWIEYNSQIYLFESKAYQFALKTKQTGDIDLLLGEVKKKIVNSIEQVYRRISDIDKYEELSFLRGKKIIPVIVFMEIPLISGHLYKELIQQELDELEKKGLIGIKEFKCYLINIEELELYSSAVDSISLDEAFARYEGNLQEGFISIISKVMNRAPHNKYLNEVYEKFWELITGVKFDKLRNT